MKLAALVKFGVKYEAHLSVYEFLAMANVAVFLRALAHKRKLGSFHDADRFPTTSPGPKTQTRTLLAVYSATFPLNTMNTLVAFAPCLQINSPASFCEGWASVERKDSQVGE